MTWKFRLSKGKSKTWRLTIKKWSKLWIKRKMKKQEINWITLFLNFNKNLKNSQNLKSKRSPKSFDFQSFSRSKWYFFSFIFQTIARILEFWNANEVLNILFYKNTFWNIKINSNLIDNNKIWNFKMQENK